jgi:hypothetical protein
MVEVLQVGKSTVESTGFHFAMKQSVHFPRFEFILTSVPTTEVRSCRKIIVRLVSKSPKGHKQSLFFIFLKNLIPYTLAGFDLTTLNYASEDVTTSPRRQSITSSLKAFSTDLRKTYNRSL